METAWLQSVVETPGPYASVHVDVSRTDAAAQEELRLRWAAVRRSLAEDGAPDDVVAVVEERVLAPTGLAGEQGRSIIATPGGVLLDRVVPRRPLRDSGRFGSVPHLMPVVRALEGTAPYALVEVDRAGADVTLVDAMGRPAEEAQVEGGHDVLHKVGGGGWSHRRFQMRVEDSWERNATAVAEHLDDVVARNPVDLVLLTGDPQACTYVRRHATGRVAERLVEVEGGGRNEGVHPEAFARRVDEVLAAHGQRRMGDVLARFEQERGRDGAAAAGLPGVVEALRGGAVEVLLLHDDPSSTAELWAGEQPLHLGCTEDEVRALGSASATTDRADAVLLRALVAQKGEVVLVEGESMVDGGVGALLRFDVRPPVPGR